MQAVGAHLIVFDKERVMPLSCQVGGPVVAPEFMQRYMRDYACIDPLIPACFHAPVSANAMLCQEFLSDEAVAKSEFYQDFFIPGGCRYQAGWKLENSRKRMIVLSAHQRKTHFERNQLAPWEPVLEHARHAARLGAEFAPRLVEGDLLRQALNHLRMACIMVDSNARVIDGSATAIRLLENGSVLKLLWNGQLATKSSEESRQLCNLIERAAAGRLGGVMLLARDSPGGSWELQIVPSGVARENPFDRRFANCALVFVKTPKRSARPDWDKIHVMLHCTRAEAEVAADLVGGMTPSEIAMKRNVSIHTVRSQIRILLAGMGLHRIAQLVSFLTTTDKRNMLPFSRRL
jgi:DNA-binding CsgD family transcriptional regulator